MEIKLKIAELVIRLLCLILAWVVIPAFKKWLEAKSSNETEEKIRMWVNSAVNAAEQMYNHAENYDPDGTKRKRYAHEAVVRICLRNGIVLTDKEVDLLIEAAVNSLNIMKKSFLEGELVGEGEDV